MDISSSDQQDFHDMNIWFELGWNLWKKELWEQGKIK